MITTSLPLLLLCCVAVANIAVAGPCPPTEPDEVGPFYRPDAPLRSAVGSGYALSGTVRSTIDCSPIPGARIEFWQAGPSGQYDDAHRATVVSNSNGSYRFLTDPPPPYMTRPPHIHILVLASGYQRLITQHYPMKRARSATFDLVLIPDR